MGFVPNNSFFKTQNFGFGLWTFEDPDMRGRCITPVYVTEIGGLTNNDRLYKHIWLNGDLVWSSARIIASIGLFFGVVAMVFVWISLFSKTSQLFQIDITLATTTLALACEGTKFGLFFDSQPCVSDTFWEYVDEDEVSYFNKAATCVLARGTYMSTCSLVFYSLIIIYLTLARIFPYYDNLRTPDNNAEFDYDDVTIPSFLGSIGKSVTSKFSGVGSSISFDSKRSKVSSRRGSNGSRPISSIMEPIVEGDDDDRDDDFVNSIVGGNSIITRSTVTKNSKNSNRSGGSGNSGTGRSSGGRRGNREY